MDIGLGNLANQFIDYGSKDLLVSISFPRYASRTLHILKYGRNAGCKIIVITDSPVSPVGQIADLALVAGNKSSTYLNSFTSAATPINCLVGGLSLRSKNSVEVLKAVNRIVDDWKLLLI